MSKRSLKLSCQGCKTAKNAQKQKGWTNEKLAREVPVATSTISKFFSGYVDKETFVNICTILEIDHEDVVDLTASQNTESTEQIVADIRQKCQFSIIQKCGIMRVLNIKQFPIGINHIYTTVNILEKITNKQRKSIDELTKEVSANHFERLKLPKVDPKRVPGLKAVTDYDKLIVLGKPGSGKTTFLRHLAVQCISGSIFNNYLPIFIPLKDFANPNAKIGLFNYICEELSNENVNDSEVIRLFEGGGILLLLDGLDEVQQEYDNRILKDIRDIYHRFPNNKFILTCRNAAK